MASFNLTKLINRKLIKISGPDCYAYLQGLFSNDLRYLYEPDRIPKRKHVTVSPNALSSFMLNAQGRVICDVIFYRTPYTRYECKFCEPGESKEPDELFIECDFKVASGLANTLYAYRVRRKVSLEIQSNKNIWCLYPNYEDAFKGMAVTHEKLGHSNVITVSNEIIGDKMIAVHDPRLNLMGFRILANSDDDFSKIKRHIENRFNIIKILECDINEYILHKYKLGVGEGIEDHPEGNCFPLECNADLLGSVSFNKGCYLGQELTARTHYTGVIRKRLMPTVLTINKAKPPRLPFAPGSDIIDALNGKKVGVIRNIVRGQGLSLLRHDSITEASNLIHSATNIPLTTWKPFWWDADF